eukprot:8512694-Pyramimonas_sp.AAC.1
MSQEGWLAGGWSLEVVRPQRPRGRIRDHPTAPPHGHGGARFSRDPRPPEGYGSTGSQEIHTIPEVFNPHMRTWWTVDER